MSGQRAGLLVGAAIGDCVHVAGLLHFLRVAEDEGWKTVFLGPARSVEDVVRAVECRRPQVLGVSYRLSPETAAPLFAELGRRLEVAAGSEETGSGPRPLLAFGGTAPVCRQAERSGIFAAVFSPGSSPECVRDFLRQAADDQAVGGRRGLEGGLLPVPETPVSTYPQTLVERVGAAGSYPLFRHHFGQPSLEQTIKGCALLAESGLIDVISIGPDHNTQEHYFHPELMDETQTGAGGVPLRRVEDFSALFAASRRGNHPLMRCYSGTRDLIRMAEVLLATINNAWCAVPLFWYNVLDARSRRPLRESLTENMETVGWHARRGVPVEVNEAHHWSLREAPDAVAVAAAFLAAYNAKRRGVRHYVSQYMFGTPAGTHPDMDLGKMLAKVQLVEGLHDHTFISFREVRAGLAGFPADPSQAKGHLAGSTCLQLSLAPHIVHVVGYSEADHAAGPEEIIESLGVCRGVVDTIAAGLPDMAASARVRRRREELVAEAQCILEGLRELAGGADDPWADVETLARAVEVGLLDAPHLVGNPAARGGVATRMIDGMCLAVDPVTGRPVPEQRRVKEALDRARRGRGGAEWAGGGRLGRP